MNFQIRPYQKSSFEALFQAFKKHTKILMVGPPGMGKGSMIAYFMAWAASKGHRCLFLVHNPLLVVGKNSMYDRLTKQMGVNPRNIGFVMARRKQINAHIMIGNIHTAVNRKLEGTTDKTKITFILVDEAHRLVWRDSKSKKKEGQYQQLLERLPNARVIGWTATPERHSKKEYLGKYFDHCIQMATHKWMVDNRYLVPSVMYAPVTPDLRGVKVRAREYAEKDLERVYDDEVLTAIIDKIEDYWKPGMKGVVFTLNSVKQCKKMAWMLHQRGFRVDFITGKTPRRDPNNPSDRDREGILERLHRGELDMVVNINILGEGISLDSINFIVLAFSTKVRAKYIQCVTRGSRPLWANGDWLKDKNGDYVKPYYTVLDCGNNCLGEGFWTVENYLINGVNIFEPPPPPNNNRKPYKKCPNCFSINATAARECVECGHPFPWGERDEDKLLANQTDWKEVKIDSAKYNFVMKFRDEKEAVVIGYLKTYKKPELLIPICLARGRDIGWAVKLAYICKYVKNDPGASSSNFNKVLLHLEKKTTQKGYWPLVEDLIENNIKIKQNGK